MARLWNITQRLKPSDLRQILSLPLDRKIDRTNLERWSATFWDLSSQRPAVAKPFVMMFPPPNITGNLHLGHALTASIQDAVIRQRRMAGKSAIWIPGFDHAGLGAQSIVERSLWQKRAISRQELGREKFIELVNDWKNLRTDEMRVQLDRLGLALDHSREYFTMDDNSSDAVDAAFKQLFNDGIIYRAVKPVFWSNLLETTLSDAEVERVDGVDRFNRTGEIVERRPISQWFISAKEIARKSVEVVENCSIDIIPPNYKRSWSSWLLSNGTVDWCISRQSWWGHKIPAYKLNSAADIQENWIVADNYEEATAKLGGDVVQDPDILDTWFSSSLLPLTISGWPSTDKFDESRAKGFFPLELMETGHDILGFWVSKMVMMSLALTNEIPFKLILLHGMICDSKGKKMSKSKGNVIDPLDIIDGASLEELQARTKKHHARGLMDENQLKSALANQKSLFPVGIKACGADGLRSYLLSHNFQHEVISVQEMQIDKVRRLSNKIWNIFRFSLQLLHDNRTANLELDIETENWDQTKLDHLDQQVLHELSECISVAHTCFNETYQLDNCFRKLELYWTVHLSSKYLQSLKAILDDKRTTDDIRQLKLQILIKCLVTSTKLLHPFMPHLTEFLYQKLLVSFNCQTEDLTNTTASRPLFLEPYPRLEERFECLKDDKLAKL